jgi:hypothetical protein
MLALVANINPLVLALILRVTAEQRDVNYRI